MAAGGPAAARRSSSSLRREDRAGGEQRFGGAEDVLYPALAVAQGGLQRGEPGIGAQHIGAVEPRVEGNAARPRLPTRLLSPRRKAASSAATRPRRNRTRPSARPSWPPSKPPCAAVTRASSAIAAIAASSSLPPAAALRSTRAASPSTRCSTAPMSMHQYLTHPAAGSL